MKENPISQEYIHQRVRELFEEIVLSEREVIIDKLSSQYTFLKAEFAKVENERRRVNIFENQIIFVNLEDSFIF